MADECRKMREGDAKETSYKYMIVGTPRKDAEHGKAGISMRQQDTNRHM